MTRTGEFGTRKKKKLFVGHGDGNVFTQKHSGPENISAKLPTTSSLSSFEKRQGPHTKNENEIQGDSSDHHILTCVIVVDNESQHHNIARCCS